MVGQSEQKTLPGIKRPKPIKEKGKPRSKLDNRATIVVLFLITVLGSLFFYLKTEVPKSWQKLLEPRVISSLPGGVDYRPVIDQVEEITSDLQGSYGFYVYRLEDDLTYGWHEDQFFPAASLIKLPVIIALYQEVEAREIDLETKYSLKEEDKRGGAGIIQSVPAGTIYTYRKLAEFMGQQSDNTAFNVLRQILGDQKIQATINELGMRKTSLGKNETTPEEIGLLFQELYQGEILTKEDQEEILGYLTGTTFEDRIPAGVPEEVRVAHKIGTDAKTFSDAGIVFAEKPFILVIMSKDALEAEALEILPEISQIVWEFEAASL
jgi:beta-lactamase class A